MEIQELSDLARRWCEEYIVDFNKKAAALRAGYPSHSAELKGNQNYNDPRCQALVYELKRRVSLRSNISADWTLERLRMIAEAEITPVLVLLAASKDAATFAAHFQQLPDHVRAAVKSVKWGKYGPEIVLHDQLAATRDIGKYFGLFNDKIELTGPGGGPLQTITREMTPKEAADIYAQAIKGAAA
ncbi:putative terminase small subunit [Sinorhizobium phage HMSP1-Susan]|nr:putative terminase small subunit [Sinorhizobium phage HMSP1-Susan]